MTTPAAPQRLDSAATLSGRTRLAILTGVLLALFLAALDQTIVATALPRIVSDLQGLDLLAWVTTSYLLSSTALVPICGKLSDLHGRKLVLLAGLLVFLTGSVLCGISGTMSALIASRGLQGMGAAALTSTALAIPADLFAPADRARYQGIFGAVIGLASVVGPYLGGLLTDTVGWRWIFYINVPLGILATAFIAARMPRLHSGLHRQIDSLGAALLLLAVVPLLLALTLDRTAWPWTAPPTLGLFAVSAAGTLAFLQIERRRPEPIIPLGLFRTRTFALIAPASALLGAALILTVMFLSLYLVNVLGVSATTSGTALIPLTLSVVAGALLSAALVQRLGLWKLPALAGLVALGLGFLWLTTLTPATPLNEVRLRMVVVGLGLGPNLPILTLVLQNAVPLEAMGAATASRQFFQQLGQAIGAAVFGAMLTTTLSSTLEANLAPLRASLPPELASWLDVTRMRNGPALEGSGPQPSIPDRIAREIHQRFAERRALLVRAVRESDPAALQRLLADPQAPEALKVLLREGGVARRVEDQLAARKQAVAEAIRAGRLQELQQDPSLPRELREGLSRIPPRALENDMGRAIALARLHDQLDARRPELVKQLTGQVLASTEQRLASAETETLARGVEGGRQIQAAVERSFTTAITRIYQGGLPLALATLLLLLFVPQRPLRRTHLPAEPSAP